MKALLALLRETGSPAIGSASTLKAWPGASSRRGDYGSGDRCWTCTTGRPAARHAASRSAIRCSKQQAECALGFLAEHHAQARTLLLVTASHREPLSPALRPEHERPRQTRPR